MSVDALDERARGPVLTPGDPGYEAACRIWNARVDREPAVVLRCAGAADLTSSHP